MGSLRSYQADIKNRVRESYRKYKAPIVVLPCRSGKSIILADIAKDATSKGNSVLVIVHRQELCSQLRKTFTDWGVNMDMCDIGMVQTLSNRLDKLPKYDFIITDENHHAPANSYKKIYNHYPNAKRLGATATAEYNGKGSLLDTNDVIIEGVTAKWLIKNNYIAPFLYYAPKLIADFTNTKIVKGDFDTEAAEKIMSESKIYSNIIESWQKYANNKKTIAYCCTVQHSKNTAEMFISQGIKAAHIDAKTPKLEREQIYNDFKNGDIMMLCNCNIFSEGIDIDGVECCLLLRPTMSLTLYLQSAMRCMTYKQGKTAIIIDTVGNAFRHGLPDTERKWSLESKQKHIRQEQEPEVKARQCGNCFKVYAGINPICPYCNYNNAKTRAQIKQDEAAELQRITEIEKQQDKNDLRQAGQSLQSLEEYGRKKGYKPGWAWNRWNVLQKYRR